MSSSDLDEYLYGLAVAYLYGRPVERPEYARPLIRRRAVAVPPIVRAVAQQLLDQAEQQRTLAARSAGNPDGESFTKTYFLRVIADPILRNALQLLSYMGPSAGDALIDLVEDGDRLVTRVAALMLASLHLTPDSDLLTPVAARRLPAVLRLADDELTSLLLDVCLARRGDVAANRRLAVTGRRAGLASGDVHDGARCEGALAILDLGG